MSLKTIMLFLASICVASTISYILGAKNAPTESTTKEWIFECPYIVKGGGFKEHVRLNNEVKVLGKPEFIDNPQVTYFNQPFVENEFEKDLYKVSDYKGWDSREFDVDGDGENEMIINANVVMNHTPHIAMIVDNGTIVFEAKGANIWIEEVDDNEGFLLSETIDWNT